ncbi:HNH endonuclease [Thioclava dalianensis]|uniref:HNH endonuclease n=1 Tax=Thioclava dalianensis TaxID=1185766 RepID=A0A074U2E1_9RHOB|nr:HNH endonuclease signature motif containing protein [Thioclava dalianensis]KEP68802.1 HNH endonuclease [Thioclava dalianensis]SFN49141.1 HNH endonuclease [Thioclava dalianensis]
MEGRKRKRLTKWQRADVLQANGYLCYLCEERINSAREDWEVEHVIPFALGGADDPSNMRPVHCHCHKEKTKTDVTRIAKAKRVKKKHDGTFRPTRNPVPGSKATGLKKMLDGSVIDRATGRVIKQGWKK